MKIITIGDLHGKDVWRQINLSEFDLMVFLGDYVDSFDKSDEETAENLRLLISLKNHLKSKVIFLIGNHDLQYITGKSYNLCSGYVPQMFVTYNTLFKDNRDMFQIAYQVENYLFTHAGVTNEWYNTRAMDYIEEYGLGELVIAEQLNQLFKVRHSPIDDIGDLRGGYLPVGGPLWADKFETKRDALNGINQIVGHSQVMDIVEVKSKDNSSVTYCDCLNTVVKFHELNIN